MLAMRWLVLLPVMMIHATSCAQSGPEDAGNSTW